MSEVPLFPGITELAALLQPGVQIGLSGELGAGKTTFVRMLLDVLGSSDPVSSPSFALCHEYTTASGLVIEHWDIYRLTTLPEELEFPPSPNSCRIIEWASRLPDEVSLDLHLTFTVKSNEKREITLSGPMKEKISWKGACW